MGRAKNLLFFKAIFLFLALFSTSEEVQGYTDVKNSIISSSLVSLGEIKKKVRGHVQQFAYFDPTRGKKEREKQNTLSGKPE